MAMFRRLTIPDGAEMRRVRSLPRREWTEEQGIACAHYYTNVLKTSHGTWSLRPMQAIALHEINTVGGLFGPIRVGGGKTLLSLLAPAMRPECLRPILLLPAALVEKTRNEWRILAQHWRIPQYLQIQSYETLGRVNAARWLETQRPDMIIADEAHRLKNPRAGVTRRVARYMQANPDVKFVAISGTLLKDNLEDFAHLLQWALKSNAPVPLDKGELMEWAACLGAQKNPLQEYDPGPLLSLGRPEDIDGEDLSSARKCFRRRLRETPGVVASGDEHVSCSLYIQAVTYSPNVATEENFRTLRQQWETPDGWMLADAVSVWRHARELALGWHSVWDPRPPPEWLDARREWASHVRKVLSHSKHLDTELAVRQAVEAGDIEGQDILDAWLEIKPTFTVQPKPIWHDTGALEFCKAWAEKAPGIIWTEHTFFARTLAKMTGLHYYGEDGVSETDGTPIEAADPSQSLIASRPANGTGRNLQAWNRNLITSPPSGGPAWEQMLGRTHRDGQQADTVTADVFMVCREHFESITRATENARVNEQTIGHSQKLLLADINLPSEQAVEAAARQWIRWDKTGG